MVHSNNIRQKLSQLGLILLPPRIYYRTLLYYTDWVSKDCYRRIVQAHLDDNGGIWEGGILPCEIESEGFIINIATGRSVNTSSEIIIGGFPNLIHYENFRADINDEVNRLIMIATEIAYSENRPSDKLI